MKLRELNLKCRMNKANGQINVALPKKSFTTKELDKIQKTNSIKLLMEQNE